MWRERVVAELLQPAQPQQYAVLRQCPPLVPLEVRVEPLPPLLEPRPVRPRLLLLHEPFEPLQHMDDGPLLRERQTDARAVLRTPARPSMVLLQSQLPKEHRQEQFMPPLEHRRLP